MIDIHVFLSVLGLSIVKNDCYGGGSELINISNNIIYNNDITNSFANIFNDQNASYYQAYIAYILEFMCTQSLPEGSEVIKDVGMQSDVGCTIIFPNVCKSIVKLHLTDDSNLRFIIYGGHYDLFVFKGKTSQLTKITFINPSELLANFSDLFNHHKLAYLALKYGDVSRQTISERFAFIVGRCPTLPMSVIKSVDCQLYQHILTAFGLGASEVASLFGKEGSLSNVYAATQMTRRNKVFQTKDRSSHGSDFFCAPKASIKVIKNERSHPIVNNDVHQLSCSR